MKPKILVLNGPNLNLLGQREPELYGSDTLADIERAMRARADALGLALDFRQSNHEGELVEWIHEARESAQGIVINPAAYTTTSIAILDALLACPAPIIEVHLTNIHKRERFRQHSYVSRVARGVLCGFGAHGYLLALEALAKLVQPPPGA